MTLSRFFALGATLALTAVTTTACGVRIRPADPAPTGAVQLANPASTYCVQRGGTLSIQKDAAGNESGLCTLPDGTAMDEWALFRRDHPAAESK